MGNLRPGWIGGSGALRAEEGGVRLLASAVFAVLASSAFALAGCSGAPDPTIGADPVQSTPTPVSTTPVPVATPDAGSSADAGADASANGGKDYVVDDAVTFAASHWDDGVGECAEFVSDCLRAGHLDIPVLPWVPDLLNKLESLGIAHDEALGSDDVAAQEGDVVFFSDASGDDFCDDHSNDEGNCGHTCLVTVAGSTTHDIEVDCHNNAHHEEALYTFFGGEYSRYRIYHVAPTN